MAANCAPLLARRPLAKWLLRELLLRRSVRRAHARQGPGAAPCRRARREPDVTEPTGGPVMTPPLISSDSHVDLLHDVIKSHLATKFHDAYDNALAQARREMLGGNAAKANMAGLSHVHPAYGRPGHRDPVERLKD